MLPPGMYHGRILFWSGEKSSLHYKSKHQSHYLCPKNPGLQTADGEGNSYRVQSIPLGKSKGPEDNGV